MLVTSGVKNKVLQRKSIFKTSFIYGLYILLFFGLIGLTNPVREYAADWLRLKGFFLKAFKEDPNIYAKAIPSNLFSSIGSFEKLPVLAIDIKFKNWQKLAKKRQIALATGALLKDENDYVKASLRFQNKISKVMVRLKGDQLDHFLGKKWSLRVKVLGQDRIFGLKRFSIQNPRVRRYQAEPMFYQMLKDFGIIVPRYFFVQAYVNGENIGVMAIEEHFSKEMIENNRRKESVFIGIDEARIYSGKDHTDLLYETNLKTFQHNGVLQSKNLTEDFDNAVGLLRSFLNTDIGTTGIFDEVLMGRFLALVDVWSAGHGLNENSRFYYNPINALIEPVGFDSNIGDNSGFNGDNILGKLIINSAVRLVYADTLNKIEALLSDQAYLNKLDAIDKSFENQLRNEFFLKPPRVTSRFKIFRERLKIIKNSLFEDPIVIGSSSKCDAEPFSGWAVDLSNPNRQVDLEVKLQDGSKERILANKKVGYFHKLGLSNLGLTSDSHGFSLPKNDRQLIERCRIKKDPMRFTKHTSNIKQGDGTFYSLIDALIYLQDQRPVIELVNITSQPVKILNIFKDDKPIAFKNHKNSLLLNAKERKKIYLPKEHGFDKDDAFTILSTFPDGNEKYFSKIMRYAPFILKNPIPNSNESEQLARHSFLSADSLDKILTISKGIYEVKENIIVPPGFKLVVNEGVQLKFSSDIGIICHGQIFLKGTKKNPIIMKSLLTDKYWNGIVVIGNHKKATSSVSDVMISDVKNVNTNKWRQTGSIVFYRSDVKIVNLNIQGVHSEDAINLIESRFHIEDLFVKDTTSDAVDIDFSEGYIFSSQFEDIGHNGGGDAIDVSGSYVNLDKIAIDNVNDKAVSVGEKSNVSASNLHIKNSNIGIASKDSSDVTVYNSSFSEIHEAAFMAYIKKLEYGPSRIIANNIVFQDASVKAKVQSGSKINLNEKAISTEEINVESLYPSIYSGSN